MKKNFRKRYLRKFAALLLAVTMLFSAAGSASAKVHLSEKLQEEMKRDYLEWAIEATDWFHHHPGYRKIKAGGMPMTSNTTRNWLIEILYSMESYDQWNGDKSDPYAINFPYLNQIPDDGSACSGIAEWIKESGIWYEENDTLSIFDFNKDREVLLTREDLITIVYRYMQYRDKIYRGGTGEGLDVPAEYPAQFTDTNEVADYADEAMRWAIAHNIVNGRSAGRLAPKSLAMRAEKVTVLYRAMRQLGYDTPIYVIEK